MRIQLSRLLLLLLVQSEERDTRDLEDLRTTRFTPSKMSNAGDAAGKRHGNGTLEGLETYFEADTWNITLSVARATETSNQNLVLR